MHNLINELRNGSYRVQFDEAGTVIGQEHKPPTALALRAANAIAQFLEVNAGSVRSIQTLEHQAEENEKLTLASIAELRTKNKEIHEKWESLSNGYS